MHLTLIQKALKVSTLFAKVSLTKMDKSVLQEIRADIQELLSHNAFGNLQIFSINAKGFGSEEKVLRGRDIQRF